MDYRLKNGMKRTRVKTTPVRRVRRKMTSNAPTKPVIKRGGQVRRTSRKTLSDRQIMDRLSRYMVEDHVFDDLPEILSTWNNDGEPYRVGEDRITFKSIRNLVDEKGLSGLRSIFVPLVFFDEKEYPTDATIWTPKVKCFQKRSCEHANVSMEFTPYEAGNDILHNWEHEFIPVFPSRKLETGVFVFRYWENSTRRDIFMKVEDVKRVSKTPGMKTSKGYAKFRCLVCIDHKDGQKEILALSPEGSRFWELAKKDFS